jgi:hypothetical protein
LASLRKIAIGSREAPAPLRSAVPPALESEPTSESGAANARESARPKQAPPQEVGALPAVDRERVPASGAPEPAQLEIEPLGATDEERMVETLGEMRAGKVAIREEKDDTDALHFGEWLGHVFMRAGWTVTTLQACPLPREEQNLTLATSGNFPFPKMAATIHRAFAAVGLGLVFGIDPMSDSPIPTLVCRVSRRRLATA